MPSKHIVVLLEICIFRHMSDSTTAIAGINKQGSTHSMNCQKVAKDVWLWAFASGIWLSAAHIRGIHNVEANQASRIIKDELECTLCSSEFQTIL